MTEQVPPGIERLIESLLTRTRARTLPWEANDWPFSFILPASSGTVVLECRDRDGVAPYILRVLDPRGVEVDSFIDVGFYPPVLEPLYQEVRAQTRTSSDVLDSLLAELEMAS